MLALVDELPDVPGLRELWGTSVAACPHCHGWEVRGEPLAQLGLPGGLPRTVDRALLLSRWSEDVVLHTQGEELGDDQLARLHRAAVFVSPAQRQQTDLARRLGCRVGGGAQAGAVEVDACGRTSVAGIWAAGTTAQPTLLGVAAAGAASAVAVAMHRALLEDELAAGS